MVDAGGSVVVVFVVTCVEVADDVSLPVPVVWLELLQAAQIIAAENSKAERILGKYIVFVFSMKKYGQVRKECRG